MSNVIAVGQSSEARFCVYGDESRFRDILVFAFAIFNRGHVVRATKILEEVRRDYRIPSTTPIHCRLLYNAEARRKYGLEHLNEVAVNELIGTLVARMKSVPAACRFAWTRLPKRALLVNSADPMWVLPSEPKGILGLLMQTCFAVPADGRHGPSASECEIFVSADPTRIHFLGDKKYQAHRGYSGFSDIGAPAHEVFNIQPHVIGNDQWSEQPLLQVGDVFAYICSHSDPALQGKDFFTPLLKTMYWSRATLELDAEVSGEADMPKAEEQPG